MERVCVFGASSQDMEPEYFQQAYKLGQLLAGQGIGLVFGGGNTGLMGAVARGVHENGGRVTGVIPEKLNVPGIAYPDCDELIVTATMHERKARMEQLSQGYVALPGGYGTLEELLEVLTLNQLGYIEAPLVLLNTRNYYAALLKQLEDCVAERFTHPAYGGLLCAAKDAEQALYMLQSYRRPELPNKIKEALKSNGNCP